MVGYYWKPSQLLRTNEVMDIGGEHIHLTITLPKQHNPKLHSKYVSLYPQISVALISHQGNFSSQ